MIQAEHRAALEAALGYQFQNGAFLERALTHSSFYKSEKGRREPKDNERMEFLGDSVLSLVTSEYLFASHPEMPEGELSRVRAAAVCEKALCEFAHEIDLGDYILLGHGEDMNRGRERASITSDAFEALLAAVYIDSGYDFEAPRAIVLPFIKEEIEAIRSGSSFEDCKTALQHIVQQVNSEKLEYVLVGESGPDHDKVFEVEARLNSNVIGRGKARSKREAEQLAAKEALRLFGEK